MTMQEAILEERKFEGIREGIEKGKQITKEEVVTRMITHRLSDDQILEFVEVPHSVVQRLRKEAEKVEV